MTSEALNLCYCCYITIDNCSKIYFSSKCNIQNKMDKKESYFS